MATDMMRVADALLRQQGSDLEDYLTSHSDLSHAKVARDLWQRTDGVIDVSGETIRRWSKAISETDGAAA